MSWSARSISLRFVAAVEQGVEEGRPEHVRCAAGGDLSEEAGGSA